MQADHPSIRHIIDQSLAGAASDQERQSLGEHLPTCVDCQQYLEASNRAIASLEGFSFPIDPMLNSKVLASLARRAQQLEAERLVRKRLWWASCLALIITAVGSFAVSQLGSLGAAIFHIQPEQVHLGLVTFWIAPSLCVCLLFLLLPVLPALLSDKKGLSL